MGKYEEIGTSKLIKTEALKRERLLLTALYRKFETTEKKYEKEEDITEGLKKCKKGLKEALDHVRRWIE